MREIRKTSLVEVKKCSQSPDGLLRQPLRIQTMLSLVTGALAFDVRSAVMQTPTRAPQVAMKLAIGNDLIVTRDPLGFGTGIVPTLGQVVPTKDLYELPVVTDAPAPVTKKEVEECQAKWAAAIASISSVYLEEGDFVSAAAEAAGELYGYGHFDVLFKPTK